MELTNGQIKNILISAEDGHLFSSGIVKELCTALLAELDKPKVWTNAPDNAVRALTYFYDDKRSFINEKEYTRTLTKSRIDEIAESKALLWSGCNKVNGIELVELIKSAILKDREERGEK